MVEHLYCRSGEIFSLKGQHGGWCRDVPFALNKQNGGGIVYVKFVVMAGIELPPYSLMQHMILGGLKVPVIFNRFIDDWEILSWSLDTWAEKLDEQVLPFRSGVRKSTKVS
jgi:hypothetical protein